MSQWNERFKDHPVWKALNDLGPAIDQALQKENNEPLTVEMLSRSKAVQSFLGRRLAGADRYLLIPAPLDNINAAILAATNELRSYISNSSAGHLTNANAQMDSALAYVTQLNYPYLSDDFQAAKEAADAYRGVLDSTLEVSRQATSSALTELGTLRTRINELNAATEAEKARLTTITTEFQSQFSTAQQTRIKEFSDGQQQRLDNFSKLQTEYTQKLSDQNAEFTKSRDDALRAQQTELADLTTRFVASSNEIRDQILERKAEVEKLVGVIGNLGVTSGYQKSANTAVLTARLWQAATVASLGGLIWIAYIAFLPLVQGTFTWSGFAGRVFVSLTVAVLAAYAASQADRYQKLERNNRRLALELEAIGPFIAPLPIEKQHEFLLKIGERSFGQSDDSQFGPNTKSPATIVDVLLHSKELRSFITDMVKAAKA